MPAPDVVATKLFTGRNPDFDAIKAACAELIVDRNNNVVFDSTFTQKVSSSVPLTGFSVSFNSVSQPEMIFLQPAGTLATGTLVFPPAGKNRVGQILSIMSTQIVTSLTVTSTGLTLVGTAVTALAANVRIAWQCVALNTFARIT
jgi:hypothetical protein